MKHTVRRRTFLQASASALAATNLFSQPELMWGGPVLDTHLHLRRDPDACFTHLQGCGVTNAILLTSAADEGKAKQEMAKHPGVFVRSVATDPAQTGADEVIRSAIRDGAVSIGELKHHIALDSPEMRRVYDICVEMHVPVMMHIQTYPHFPGELPYNTGYPEFGGYPSGPIKPGGLTDKFLSNYPNMYVDMSANSGNNALSRDTAFSREFIVRHRTKLIFGSDCACTDGKGAGISQGRNPEAARLAGQCVARARLTLLEGLTTPQIFRQITWENGRRMFQVRA